MKEEDPRYALRTPYAKTCSFDLSQLMDWIDQKREGKEWIGRIYVATTIKPDNGGFAQTGCAPNFMADYWSLCCCKHPFLRGDVLSKWLETNVTNPVFIFVVGSVDAFGDQPLVSVAKITDYFNGPKEYASFVRDRKKLAASRLSGLTPDDHARLFPDQDYMTYQAWLFGDCHADERRDVGEPFEKHVHHARMMEKGKWEGKWYYEKDNELGTRKLLTQTFLNWDKPRIITTKTLGAGSFPITAKAWHENQTKMWEGVLSGEGGIRILEDSLHPLA